MRVILSCSLVLTLLFVSDVSAQIGSYAQDFEGLTQSDTAALANDGWQVFGSVTDGSSNFKFAYGPFVAPNNQPGTGFSNIETGQGGGAQGTQYINVFSDYQCCVGTGEGHFNGTDIVTSSVFQQRTVDSSDHNKQYRFKFDATLPGDATGQGGADNSAFDLQPPSTGTAYIRTLDPNNGFATTAENVFGIGDLGLTDSSWTTVEILFDVLPLFDGNIFEFGFSNTSSNFGPTGVYFDNISLEEVVGSVPEDLNNDGFVDGLDLGILLGSWNTNTTPDQGELNGTPPVDGLDLGILLAAWNPPPAAATAAVPEPTTLMLAGLSSLALLYRRNR